MPESKFSISGFVKDTFGLDPASIPPASANFALGSACPAEELKAAQPARLQPGITPISFATAGSMVPPDPVAAVVGAPHDGHAAVFGAKKLLMSVCPIALELPNNRLRNAVRW